MKILLAHKFHKLTGGAEVFYFDVARVLKEKGHEVAFFSVRDNDNIKTGDPLYEVDGPSYNESNVVQKIFGSFDILYSSSKYSEMERAIEEFKPDILHVFAIHVHLTPSILEAAKKCGVPVLMSCNDYKHICPNYKLYAQGQVCYACKGEKFFNATLKKCCKDSVLFSVASTLEAYVHKQKKVYENLVDKYLFASDFMLNKTKEFWSNKSVSYGILKNPFDATLYEPSYKGGYALYFGRIVEEKGVDKILDAALKLTLPIKIVGDGSDLQMLKEKADNQSIDNIEFKGALWGNELIKELTGARYVIVPSLWHENFPYVIFQAFAAGKPVIGSKRGGIPELIGCDRGLIFDPDNADELVSAMEKLWKDENLCEKYGRSAREYVVKEYSDATFYRSLMNNYKSVL